MIKQPGQRQRHHLRGAFFDENTGAFMQRIPRCVDVIHKQDPRSLYGFRFDDLKSPADIGLSFRFAQSNLRRRIQMPRVKEVKSSRMA